MGVGRSGRDVITDPFNNSQYKLSASKEYPRGKGANNRNKEIALTIIYHIHQRDVFKDS